MGSAISHQLIRKGKSMTILTVGIDLAKKVLGVHGVNEAGKAELIRPAVPRDKLHELIASLPPCIIGMEACSGAHHWARLFQASGHTVRLIAPKFVTPYRMTGKRGKNDAADAAAICEAIQRPHMRFVPLKDMEQQSRLMVHRARQGFVEQRAASSTASAACSANSASSRTNGALLSCGYLGPHRNPSTTRLSPDLNGPVGRSCLAKSQAPGLTRSAGPPLDVQSVLCGAASNPNSGLEENSKGDYRKRPEPNWLINREVPVEGLGRTDG